MTVLRKILIPLLTTGVVLVGVFIDLQIDFNIDPEPYELLPPPRLIGSLVPNTKLRNAHYLLSGQIKGPESLHIEGDFLFTGTWDGKVVRIALESGLITREYRLRTPPLSVKCDASYDSEPICGRPLGIRRLEAGRLVIADAYFGLFVLDVESGHVQHILTPNDTIVGSHGETCVFFNDLDVFDTDTVIFSCTSTRWTRRDVFQAIMEQRSDAAILRYRIPSHELTILADGLRFANGVQLTADKAAVMFSELGMMHILRLHLNNPNAKPMVFLANLPGAPDNIRATSKGTFLVGLAGHRSADGISLTDVLGPLPFLRKAILHLAPTKFAARHLIELTPRYGFVIEFDDHGKVVATYQDPDGRVIAGVSEAIEHDGFLYIGSFKENFLAKVPKKGF